MSTKHSQEKLIKVVKEIEKMSPRPEGWLGRLAVEKNDDADNDPTSEGTPIDSESELDLKVLQGTENLEWSIGYLKTGMNYQHVLWIRQGSNFQSNLVHATNMILGYHNPYRSTTIWPMESLVAHYQEYKEYDGLKQSATARDFLATIKIYYDINVQRVDASVKNGEIEFDDLPFYFVKGMKIAANDGLEMTGGIIERAYITATYTGTRLFIVDYRTIHNYSAGLQYGTMSSVVQGFSGRVKFSSLSVRRLTDDEKTALSERGRNFLRAVAGYEETNGAPRGFNFYSGQLIQRTWHGDRVFRAEGRIMVDSRTGMRVEDQIIRDIARYRLGGSQRSLDDDEGGNNNNFLTPDAIIEGDLLFMTAPTVIAFSFSAKRWGECFVDQIVPIEWADKSFDLLVLDPELKDMVRSLVTHHEGSFGDIIGGKGGGIIFLLHGLPGTGKTLTAETVAELLHRPLYSVTVGELGVDPTQLEESLRRILDVATFWDAVLLIDEADIFLEERNEEDILRNAMVGVFLRLLEYHQGVLFLTTNRVKNIDRAFYSRISVGLRYGNEDDPVAKRRKIWENLLSAAKIELTPDDLEHLVDVDLNGRQIKNVIRISQTLARSRELETPTLDIFDQVIDSIHSFQQAVGYDIHRSLDRDA